LKFLYWSEDKMFIFYIEYENRMSVYIYFIFIIIPF